MTSNEVLTGGDHSDAARAVIERWIGLGRPIVGALIHGSIAELGYAQPGADLDLRVVTPCEPQREWFEEIQHGQWVVEIYPLDAGELADEEAVLAHPALPFALCGGIIVYDPRGLLVRVRDRLSSRLCLPRYRRARIAVCYKGAMRSLAEARTALGREEVGAALSGLVTGLWHAVGIPAGAECRSPTVRRAFTLLSDVAARWDRPDLIERAKELLAPGSITEPEARRLVGEAAEIKARHRTMIEPMLDEGHVWQAAWPLLWAAILDAPRDGSRAVAARGHILRALRLDTEEVVGARLVATEEWLGALRDAAEERVRAVGSRSSCA